MAGSLAWFLPDDYRLLSQHVRRRHEGSARPEAEGRWWWSRCQKMTPAPSRYSAGRHVRTEPWCEDEDRASTRRGAGGIRDNGAPPAVFPFSGAGRIRGAEHRGARRRSLIRPAGAAGGPCRTAVASGADHPTEPRPRRRGPLAERGAWHHGQSWQAAPDESSGRARSRQLSCRSSARNPRTGRFPSRATAAGRSCHSPAAPRRPPGSHVGRRRPCERIERADRAINAAPHPLLP